MSVEPTVPNRIRQPVLQVRQWLSEGRDKLRSQHRAASPGIQVCTRLSDLLDTVVLEVFEAAINEFGSAAQDLRSRIALVPYGGYGRREMAPFSDVDLMLLHSSGSSERVAGLAKRLVQDLSDVGVDLGFSVRTPRQAKQMASRDAVIFTSLVDSRFLGGSVGLYSQFIRAFAKMTRRRSHALVAMIEEARREERHKYGETVYLLEPNVKRSGGGLRDLQTVRWIGFARYGHRDPAHLERSGLINRTDYQSLRKAQAFLLQLRNELHFHAGSACDVLYRSDQVRIAELRNYKGLDGLLPVEQFMQEYFNYTATVRSVVGHFVSGARWKYPRLRRVAGTLASHRIGRDFRASPSFISATRHGLPKLRSNLAEILRLMDLTSRYDCRIDHPTWQAIRAAMMQRDDLIVDRPAAKRFLMFLSHPNQLGRLLRRLHELRVLGKLVPGFEHARCLLQFNEYHKYTVDEHSFRAVERATEFATIGGTLQRAYSEIKQKDIFHLALLVHDLGKGFQEDHSEVGARIAEQVAETLFLSQREAETLRFLVHRHLMLSHLAFRRDTSDERVVVEHAAEIGSPSMLRMLYVLTCADLAAVGPGVLNSWKRDVLSQLYLRMMDQLSGGLSPTAPDRLAAKKLELLQDSRTFENAGWFEKQIVSLPPNYLDGPSQQTILDDLTRLQSLPRGQATAWGRYLPERQAIEYSVGLYDEGITGVFHRLTGALTSQGLEILAAEIHTLADQLCLDRFYVQDNDFSAEPTRERYDAVCQSLVESLTDHHDRPPVFRRTFQTQRESAETLTYLETRVKIDNTTSDLYTIIDVFTHDRKGLLYVIARALFDLELSVERARIGTYLDQVVDVFYVTERNGCKLAGDHRIEQVRARLLDAISSCQNADHPA